FMPKYSI
nr:Chain E, PHE-MET-PRO-LYS-TYR-SER-ILE [synthetic construct]8CM9_F Chain F, PHE-MET-PRO-LYS-TYR-SER-ILE [synthetic construct]8CM9_G Chain G, PHE-MET-PRO-LYS-TYR-SER-ILE [synthetic construct]8CM9_H Chain H, PHE-MET-PRO-LYS-TYR-SER-ILE [synthetic construct]